jgi:hypothetical protein
MLEQEIEKYLSGQTLCNCDSVSYRNIKNLILDFAEPREKRIAELEKENAELKKLKRECETSLCRAEYQYNYEQLTKAKEIIREFMKYEINEYDGSLEIHFEELKKQAKQFISEVEK